MEVLRKLTSIDDQPSKGYYYFNGHLTFIFRNEFEAQRFLGRGKFNRLLNAGQVGMPEVNKRSKPKM